MKNNFDRCFQLLLIDEGGYGNDPADSGGATKYGVTIGDYRKYIKAGATPNDVKTLTTAQAKSIYKSKYWDAISCDDLPAGVDDACFNYGVLAGVGRPRADLKRFANIKDPNKLIDAICDEMQSFLSGLSSSGKNVKFRAGWLTRVRRLRTNSHKINKDYKSGPLSAIGTMGVFGTISQFWHQHEVAIISSGVVLAILIGAGVHIYRNRK